MEILTNKRPWAGMSLMGVRLDELVKKEYTPWHHFKKTNPELFNKLDTNAAKMCELCMNFDHNNRPSVDEVLQMEYSTCGIRVIN